MTKREFQDLTNTFQLNMLASEIFPPKVQKSDKARVAATEDVQKIGLSMYSQKLKLRAATAQPKLLFLHEV